MSRNTNTNTISEPDQRSCTPSRAARELGLKRRDFELAVHLGLIRTVPDDGGGGRRVARAEIDRLRAEDGFPEALGERVRTVGTREGTGLLGVTRTRFTRLARLGLIVPVTFYLNRYRAVVWLYLAEELQRFAADENNVPLLKGRTPPGLRDQLETGLDLRPRNWRGRHLGFLLRQAGDDPWARAAAVACLLDPVQVAEIVGDPYERAHLNRLRPTRPRHGSPGSPTADLAEKLMTADDLDEIGWLRADLARAVDEARARRPAPRPATQSTAPVRASEPTSPAQQPPAPAPAPESTEPTSATEQPPAAEERGWRVALWGRLRRRSP